MKAAIIYWSKTGNTEKVALAINEAIDAQPHQGIEQRIPCQPERGDGAPVGGKVVAGVL